MRQRVMIAIAISCGPQLLLADEPTTALDVTVQKQVLDLLTQQKHSRHMAMVLVTHDLGVVAAHSDQVAVMYAGRIVEMAPTKKLFSRPHMPYTEALFESIPRAGDPSHKRLNAIGGRPPNLAALPPGCAFAERCRYAEERCRRERPDLRPIGVDGTHLVACWKPVGLDGQSARGAA
jgi:peptide/nickel transport system ATP-binding protein